MDEAELEKRLASLRLRPTEEGYLRKGRLLARGAGMAEMKSHHPWHWVLGGFLALSVALNVLQLVQGQRELMELASQCETPLAARTPASDHVLVTAPGGLPDIIGRVGDAAHC